MTDLLDDLRSADPCRAAAPDADRAHRLDALLETLPDREPRAPENGDRRRSRQAQRAENGDRRRSRRRLAGAAAAAAACAFAVPLALTGTGSDSGGGPAPLPATASGVLGALAQADARTPAEEGRYAYLRTVDFISHMRPRRPGAKSSGSYVAVIPHETEAWIDRDGSAVVSSRMREEQARFPTPEDRADHERAPKLPPLEQLPTRVEQWEAAGLDAAQVRALPTDPAALRARLARARVAARQPVIAAAGQLLGAPHTPEPVRQALFRLLQAEPGARVERELTDPRGRTGVGVTFDDRAWRTTFLFQRETGALLGIRSIGKEELPGRQIDDWSLTLELGRRDTAPPAKAPPRVTVIRDGERAELPTPPKE